MTNGTDAERSAWDGRERLLGELDHYIEAAWDSFAKPRPVEPIPEPELLARLAEVLPEAPGDPKLALADAANILESSISPSRPLFLAYIGSSGLEAGVLAAALSNVYDVNMAATAGTADALETQAMR